MDELHYDLERDAVRVVLADASGRVLLFHVATEEVPGGWWELPGGGIDSGESYVEAAVREIRVDGGRSPTEIEDFVTARWWQVPEITQSQERFYPSRLPQLLPRFLAGEDIAEPFEHWD